MRASRKYRSGFCISLALLAIICSHGCAASENGSATSANSSGNGDEDSVLVIDGILDYGFYINNDESVIYVTLTADEKAEYDDMLEGDLPGNVASLADYVIQTDDLAEQIGTVTGCGDEALIGEPVYRFALLPDAEEICVIRRGTPEYYGLCIGRKKDE